MSLVLTIRTDKPKAEIGLFEDGKEVVCNKWPAHNELSQTIHKQIAKILQDCQRDWNDIEAVVCFKGPGSFTGLRIGLSVGNALAYGLSIPVVSSSGKNWINNGIGRIKNGQNEKIALPRYGASVRITKPRK